MHSMKQSEKDYKLNLGSSVNKVGKTVTQIIHFVGGEKRTFSGVRSETIKQGQFTKLWINVGSFANNLDNNFSTSSDSS